MEQIRENFRATGTPATQVSYVTQMGDIAAAKPVLLAAPRSSLACQKYSWRHEAVALGTPELLPPSRPLAPNEAPPPVARNASAGARTRISGIDRDRSFLNAAPAARDPGDAGVAACARGGPPSLDPSDVRDGATLSTNCTYDSRKNDHESQ
jgi:hypothetical protein